MVFIVNRL